MPVAADLAHRRGPRPPHVGDASGDGIPDVLAIRCVTAEGKCAFPDGNELVSGRTGETVWQRPQPVSGREVVWPVAGDLDGDGANDLLMGEEHADETVSYAPVSGRTGDELWPARGSFLSGPLLGAALDIRDAPGEDLLESFRTADHPDWLAAVPGTGGSPIWRRLP